ncbi:MAG TPA: hypothetical protein VII95_02340 [Terriglobales bacterium]
MHMTISLSHRFFTISLLALTVALSGCASRLEKPRLPDVFIDPAPGGKTNGTYTLDLFNADFGDYTRAIKNPVPTEIDLKTATALRNKMVYGVLAEIDYVYHNYEISLFMNEGSFKVATDVLQLGLGMASTITNGERSKTVLSAVLTGVTGTSLSIDKNFFRQQTVQSLISSMQAGRDRTKALIIRRLNNETASSYPFQAARSDLATYFFAGTLPGALQQLNQTAAASAKDERKALTDVTVQDVENAKKLNETIAAEFAANKLDKTVAFLKAMGVTVDDPTDKAKVEAAYRDLANRAFDDPVLKKKFDEEAKKAGLIK